MVIESHRSEQQTDAKNGEREEDPHGISHQYRLPRETAGAGSQSAPADLLDGNQHLFATSRAIARRGLPWRVRLERALVRPRNSAGNTISNRRGSFMLRELTGEPRAKQTHSELGMTKPDCFRPRPPRLGTIDLKC